MNNKSKKIIKGIVLAILILIISFFAFLLYSTQDEINATSENIDEKINDFYSDKKMGGFAVSVFTPDSVIYSKGFGYSDIEKGIAFTEKTQIYIASIAKTSIGIALMKAQEMGLLKLDDPVNMHLPFQVVNPKYPDYQISLRQLATHTSSLDYNEKVVESLYINDQEKNKSLNQFMRDYFQDGLYQEIKFSDHQPGTNYNYSNIGAGLAAYIIELKSGLAFSDFTDKYIFKPLKMNNSCWFESDMDSLYKSKYYQPTEGSIEEVENEGVKLYPCRDLITNVKDLTKYCQAIMTMNTSLLKKESFNELLRPQLSSSVTNQEEDNLGIFFTMDRNNYGITYQLTGATGGDFCINTIMYFDPKTKLGYIFIGNTGQSQLNRVNHILTYRALVSLGDNYIMSSTKNILDKIYFRWHNYYNRIRAFFS